MMNCVGQSGISARIGASVVLFHAIAGTAAGQIETRDWLLPESGSWSDASRWSESNVPDTTMEIARLFPGDTRPADAPGGIPTATIDGFYEVYRVTGDGSVHVQIAPGSALHTRGGLQGLDEGVLSIDIGNPDLEGGASLHTTGGRAFFRAAYVRLADPGEEYLLSFDTYTVLDQATVIEGAGAITGKIINYGLIRSLRYAPTGIVELNISNAEVVNRNEIVADNGAYMIFDASVIDQVDVGVMTARSYVEIRDSALSGGTLRRVGRGSFATKGVSSFENVLIDKAVVNVRGELTLLGNDLRNDGFVYVDDEDGVLLIDDELTFEGEGQVTFGGSAAPATLALSSPDGAIRNGAGHSIIGWGDIGVPMVNEGELAVSGNFNTAGFIKILGEFEQHSSGIIELTFDVEGSGLNTDHIVVDRNSAELAGTLNVRLFGDVDRFVGQPFPVVRIMQNGPDQTVNGEFEVVNLIRGTSGIGISPIAGMTYLPDRVNLTLYCIADVNRDGVVTPSDFSAWVSAYNDADELADTNLDGVTDSKDFSAWVSAFNSGCGR